VAGTDALRGFAYQQIQAVHIALDVLDGTLKGAAIRVEGVDDVVDIEVLDEDGRLVHGVQVKTRSTGPWTPAMIKRTLRRWAPINTAGASFRFVTDASLGPAAQELAAVLDTAGPSRIPALMDLLDIDAGDAERLSNARIEIHASTISNLVSSAERRIIAAVNPLTNLKGAATEAHHKALALFQLLLERGTHGTAADRVVSASELADVIGEPLPNPVSTTWHGQLRERYLDAVLAVSPSTVELHVAQNYETTPVLLSSVDLTANRASILYGPTGTGKSSVLARLRRLAADEDRIIVIARAETYLPGRLDVLVAESVGAHLGTTMPAAAGRQILADPAVVIAIDGASEIPPEVADQLGEEVQRITARPALANFLVVGRDKARLRHLLSRGDNIFTYHVLPPSRAEEDELARIALPDGTDPSLRDRLVRAAHRVLGSGAENPFVLRLFLRLSLAADTPASRKDVYARMLERIAEGSGQIDAGPALAVLGLVFAQLLQRQRRYADSYEWIELTDEAAAHLGRVALTGEQAREHAHRMGLVETIGYTGTVTVFHDSVADFLAARVYASHLLAMPERLSATDDQWLLFASELGADTGGRIARYRPFLAVRASDNDIRPMPTNELATCATGLLRSLTGSAELTVTVNPVGDGRRTASASEQRSSPKSETGTVVLSADDGPLRVAVRLWRQLLMRALEAPDEPGVPSPYSATEAVEALYQWAVMRRDRISSTIQALPLDDKAEVFNAVGPRGFVGAVGEPVEIFRAADWNVSYHDDDTVHVAAAPGVRDDHGRSTARNLLGRGAQADATTMVMKAIETLTGRQGWLA